MSNIEIYTEAGLSKDEIRMMPHYIEGDLENDFFYSTAYNKLYEYFVFTIAEMPYEAAKARTMCPDEWIIERLGG